MTLVTAILKDGSTVYGRLSMFSVDGCIRIETGDYKSIMLYVEDVKRIDFEEKENEW